MSPDVADVRLRVLSSGCEVEVIFITILSVSVAARLGFISHLCFIRCMIIKEDLST